MEKKEYIHCYGVHSLGTVLSSNILQRTVPCVFTLYAHPCPRSTPPHKLLIGTILVFMNHEDYLGPAIYVRDRPLAP